MNNTSRMTTLLASFRREMNGVVSDSMYVRGDAYGLNYGVSLSTLRRIARAEPRDHAFARYLYIQQVRELRLAALYIADADAINSDELRFWADGVINSEVAEEAAFALMCRVECVQEWLSSDKSLLRYCAVRALSRGRVADAEALLREVASIIDRGDADRLFAQGVVALLVALAQNEESRPSVLRTIDSLGLSDTALYIRSECEWQIER